MQYTRQYTTPIGIMRAVSDGVSLCALDFAKENAAQDTLDARQKDCAVLDATEQWLAAYFSGEIPDFTPPLLLHGTDFQKEVWTMLCKIPYGKTVTYGDLAQQLAKTRGIEKMSAQAVGGAVGRNPVAIIVPCHRVIGANRRLVGYNGGVDKKQALLKIEGITLSRL